MAQIKLIVTGNMEKQGLHKSLRRAFPQVKDDDEVIWEEPQKIQCVTSHRLVSGRQPSQLMRDMAVAMLAAVGIGKASKPADLVIAIDDLELENIDQEDVVAEHFRSAVELELQEFNMAAQARYRSLVRERCSFHLMKPLSEAYFFGDDKALQNAGIGSATPRLVHPTDFERFESNDPGWLPFCFAENEKKKLRKPWWRNECHPKLYLDYLAKLADPSYRYVETKHGLQALIDLDWKNVPTNGTDVDILRALFADLADWFNIPSPLGVAIPNSLYYPLPAVRRSNLLLRNM